MEKETIFNNTFGLGNGRFDWLNACVGTNGFPDSLTYAEGYLRTPEILVAVGIPVTGYPPHRSRRARFTHRAPASGVWR